MARDVLEEILSAALREKAMAAETIGDFAAGLRERARIILDERLRPVQSRVLTLEKENAWRASAIQSLTDENAAVVDENRRVREENQRVRDELAAVADENQRVKAENALVRKEHAHLLEERRQLEDECRRQKEEKESLRQEWRTASLAHDRLLEHHRGVTRTAAVGMAEAAALPLWKRGLARSRLQELAAALRKDTV